MGSNNAQNLISFYLNAQMYRKFAKSELETKRPDTKLALQDFAKGLINSYLMQNVDEVSVSLKWKSPWSAIHLNYFKDLTNVSNIIFYKDELNRTLETMEYLDKIDECLLDELQAKIYLLMKQKYYPEFRQCTEFNKLIAKNEFMKNLLNSMNSYEDDEMVNGLSSRDTGKFVSFHDLKRICLFKAIFLLSKTYTHYQALVLLIHILVIWH
jgi:hypothetical protein